MEQGARHSRRFHMPPRVDGQTPNRFADFGVCGSPHSGFCVRGLAEAVVIRSTVRERAERGMPRSDLCVRETAFSVLEAVTQLQATAAPDWSAVRATCLLHLTARFQPAANTAAQDLMLILKRGKTLGRTGASRLCDGSKAGFGCHGECRPKTVRTAPNMDGELPRAGWRMRAARLPGVPYRYSPRGACLDRLRSADLPSCWIGLFRRGVCRGITVHLHRPALRWGRFGNRGRWSIARADWDAGENARGSIATGKAVPLTAHRTRCSRPFEIRWRNKISSQPKSNLEEAGSQRCGVVEPACKQSSAPDKWVGTDSKPLRMRPRRAANLVETFACQTPFRAGARIPGRTTFTKAAQGCSRDRTYWKFGG
jgi:hypothetical protein